MGGERSAAADHDGLPGPAGRRASRGWRRPAGEGNSEPFLDPWVFGVVYGGFIVQGLALGVLFALYAGERWGRLWQVRLRDLPVGPTTPALRATAVAAASAALLPGVTHLLWVSGSTAGLDAGRAANRTSGFYVLEAVNLLFVVITAVGVLLLAFRRSGRLSLRLPRFITRPEPRFITPGWPRGSARRVRNR